jgi:anti-sigma regulatory factor (Ser/Thr protein kinase)
VAGAARTFVEELLARRGLPAAAVQRAVLVASELVTNAYKYGQGMIELRVALPGDCIRIEVIDEGHGQVPAVREQPADETGGWGLQIVDRVARQWGVFEGTTHVWAELALD